MDGSFVSIISKISGYETYNMFGINWNSRRVYLALTRNAVDFYGRHMAAFYCAQLNCFKLGSTFWCGNSFDNVSLLRGIYRAAAANAARTVLTYCGVKYEAVTAIFTERALPAFNGLTYIPVQRANKGQSGVGPGAAQCHSQMPNSARSGMLN